MDGLKIELDAKPILNRLAALQRQIPYATSLALNALAFQVQEAERTNIGHTFRNPRPFTTRSVLVNKATKSNLSATVYVRPEVAKYLQPYETGGMHVLPGRGITLLDPVNVGLDQYGQLRRGTLARLNSRQNVFVGPVKTKSGGVINGFWQRLTEKGKHHLKLLVRFGDNKEVNKHLGFHDRGMAVVSGRYTKAFEDAIGKALATAR